MASTSVGGAAGLRNSKLDVSIPIYWYTMVSSDTTVKVSRDTLSNLERLRDELKMKSIDATVRVLIKSHLRLLLPGAFGADKGLVKPFE